MIEAEGDLRIFVGLASGWENHASDHPELEAAIVEQATGPPQSPGATAVGRSAGRTLHGQVTGDNHRDGAFSHAFYQESDLILPGDEHSFAYGLNDAGTVVGLSARSGGPVRAFVSERGNLRDLSRDCFITTFWARLA